MLFAYFIIWLIYFSICKKFAYNKEKVKLSTSIIPVALFSLVICADSIYNYIANIQPRPGDEVGPGYYAIFLRAFRWDLGGDAMVHFESFVREDIINSAIICLIFAVVYLLELRKKD